MSIICLTNEWNDAIVYMGDTYMKNSTFQIRISDKLRADIERRAAFFGVTPSEYVRNLILNDLKKIYLREEEK
nr:MAG TPA: hypothetical protein [Caudoviricetes sp.]